MLQGLHYAANARACRSPTRDFLNGTVLLFMVGWFLVFTFMSWFATPTWCVCGAAFAVAGMSTDDACCDWTFYNYNGSEAAATDAVFYVTGPAQEVGGGGPNLTQPYQDLLDTDFGAFDRMPLLTSTRDEVRLLVLYYCTCGIACVVG